MSSLRPVITSMRGNLLPQGHSPGMIQCRDDDLAPLAVGHVLAGRGIDDLQIQIVVPVMHACVVLAVDADTGSIDLCQSVNIIQFNAELRGDALAHLLAPALRADDALLEMNLISNASLFNLLGQKQRIRRSCTQNSRLQVHHHLKLFVGVAGSHGNGHCAELLTSVLETDSRRPQAVTGRDMNAVLFGNARKLIAALEHLSPVVHVLGGIRDDNRHSCRTGRRVYSHHFILFAGHKSQRIRVAQVLFLGKRQIQKILHAADVVDARLLEALSVEIVRFDQAPDLIVHL